MLTFLFTDIEGSTERWQKYPDHMVEILKRHDAIVYRSIEEQDGTVVKHTGDGFFAVFHGGYPLACALNIQKNLQTVDWGEVCGIRVRIGIHSGNAENIGEDFFGPAVNKTARIADSAWGGQIVFSEVVKTAFEPPVGSLIEDLGIHTLKDLFEPVRLFSLSSADLPLREFPPVRSLSTRHHNLPAQTTPFVGREKEIEEITGLFEEGNRLVTLAGPGGIGKTRLAIQIAAEIFEDYDNGVFFIPLDRFDSPDFLVPAIAESLHFNISCDVDEKTQLVNYLRGKSVMLVFDNFEHIIEGAVLVSELLAAAPGASALVTSREVLNVRGERPYQVTGLDLPAAGERGTAQSGAVQLFVYNAERIAPRKELTDGDFDYITRICRLLDGQPLGIELAASWFRSHSCSGIFEEIEKNTDFLSSRMRDLPERHRSLRAVFDYSWILLYEEEREVLGKLSVFRGGFDRNAAERIACAGISMLEGLVDKSLLRMGPGNRYEMLYILREYSGRKLAEDDSSLSETLDEHCSYYSEYLSRKLSDMRGEEQRDALEEVTQEIENIKIALDRATANVSVEELERLSLGLRVYFLRRGLYKQGRFLFHTVVDRLRGKAGDDLLTTLIRHYAVFEFSVGNLQETRELLLGSMKVLREKKSGPELADTLNTLGKVEMLLGDTSAAEDLFEESLVIVKLEDDERLYAATLDCFAMLNDSIRHCSKTGMFAEEALAIWIRLGDIYHIAKCYSLIAGTRMTMGEYDGAVEYYTMALEINRKCGHEADIATILNNIAITYAMTDNGEKAQQSANQSLDIRNEIGDRRSASAALANLGVLCHNHRKLETALSYYEEAMAICKEMGYRNGISSHLTNIAQTYHDMGQFEKAMELELESLDIAISVEDHWLIERALINLGLFCFRLEDFADSKSYHADGLLRANEQEHVPLVLVALLGISRLLQIDGMSKMACKILHFVLQHPGTPAGLSLDIDPVMEELQKILTREEQDECLELSGSLTMDGVVAEMHAYLSQDAGDQPSD